MDKTYTYSAATVVLIAISWVVSLFIKEPPPADNVKVTLMPMSEFQDKYGSTFKVYNTATGETVITTTHPTTHLNDLFDNSDMD